MRVWVPRRETFERLKPPDATDAHPHSVDRCAFDRSGARETQRLSRSRLVPGQPVQGPVIVEDMFSTVVVPPGATLTPDRNEHLFIAVGEP
jgi:N-methylhydantoinase A/oxoprolinase/acetone carboxylase beta subunit